MSKVLSVGRQFLKKCDLFASMQFLRFKCDAETKTLTGGFISLSVVIFLATQFTSMIIDTFGKVVITSVTDSTQATQPPAIFYSTHQNGKYFMLGIQLWGYDLTTGPRYFDITAVNAVQEQAMYSSQSIDIILQPCTKQHWAGLPEIDTLYNRVAMNTWLCLPVNKTYTVSGNYISEIQKSLDIIVSKCNNGTDPSRPCATPQEIDWFLGNDSQLYWTPYFMNPLINPQNKDYLTYYLQDKWYVMSGANYGTQMYIYSDDFQITTDQSIMPFSSQHTDTGPIVNSVFANVYNLDNTTDQYCFINFFRAPNSLVINRQFQKILDAFAYVGGLLGSFLLLLIIIIFYNQGSYELNFASALYLPQEGSPTTFRKYNLFYYIIQGIYTVFRIIGVKLNWKCTEFFYQTRKQMLKQLDVMFLFKKIHILESAMKLLLTKPQLRGLMLQHQLNVTEARKIRKQYGIKLDVARLAKHKLKKKKKSEQCQSKDSKIVSMGKLGISELDMELGAKKQMNLQQKPTMVRREDQLQKNGQEKQDDEDSINLSDYGSDSESSGAQEEHLQREQELLQDLFQLQEDCMAHKEVSMKIYDSMDPRIKKLLEKVTQIKFQSSMKLSKMRRKPRKNKMVQLDFDEQGSYQLQSPIMRQVKISDPKFKKKIHQNKNSLQNELKEEIPVQNQFQFNFHSIEPLDP